MAATKFIIEYLGSNISFTGAVVVAQLVKRLLPSTENAVIAKFYLPPTVWKRQKIKKRGRNVPFIKKLASLVHPNLWAKIFRLKFLWKWFLNVLKMCKRGKKQFSLSSPQDVESFIFYKILANLGLFSVLFTSFSHSSSNYRFNFSNIFWKKYR